MPKYETIFITDEELSAKVSEYIQQNSTAKACEKNAERLKKEIMADPRIDKGLRSHFDILSANGKRIYELQYKEHPVVKNPTALARIAELKAEIKRIEAENAVDDFYYFAMVEKTEKPAKTEKKAK